MRLHLASRWAVSLAVLALCIALIPAVSAVAATSPGWQVGSCYSSAEVQNDFVDLNSAVPCSQPHTVQVIGGARLAPVFAQYSLAQLRDQKDTGLRAALAEFGNQICSGKMTAAGVWPRQGPAIAQALTGMAATTGGGVLPGYGKAMNFGWVFPDGVSFDAGDRSMVCVVYVADSKSDGTVSAVNAMRGNLQDLGTKATLPDMRDCSVYDYKLKETVAISCAKPHLDELVVHYVAKLPVDLDKMTSERWVSFDAQCKALTDVLVGAKRKDLRVYADPGAGSKANTQIYIPCFVSLPTAANGSRPKLPGGTVVGLGTKPLKAA